MGVHNLGARMRVEDVHGGALLHWLEVGPEHHLSELVVVHVLHTGQLLAGVDVDSLVLLVDLLLNLFLDLVCREKFFVEDLLLLLMCEHLSFTKINYKINLKYRNKSK